MEASGREGASILNRPYAKKLNISEIKRLTNVSLFFMQIYENPTVNAGFKLMNYYLLMFIFKFCNNCGRRKYNVEYDVLTLLYGHTPPECRCAG